MFDFMKNNKGDIAIELGKKYRDSVHGIEGVAVCHTRHLTGCDRVCIEVLKDCDLKEFWFDISRLEGIDIREGDRKAGGPQSTPPSRTAG